LEDTVGLVFGNALDEIPKLKESFDFVFIDGMKRRTVDFLELVWDKVKGS
jgi:predicted O-methyltransferase YrrM